MTRRLLENPSGVYGGAFLLVLFGCIVAAVSGLPLTWDGSCHFFEVLDRKGSYLLWQRYGGLLLQGPAILASRISGTLRFPLLMFELGHALVPALGLAGCYAVLGRERRADLVWPFLCTGLLTLPGQVFFVSEAIASIQLFWPALFAVILPVSGLRLLLASAFAVWAASLHPFAMPLFAFSALASAWLAAVDRARRRRQVALALVCAALAGYGVVMVSDPHEVSWALYVHSYRSALRGLPLAGVLCGLGLLLSLGVPPRSEDSLLLRRCRLPLLLAGFGCFLAWAVDTRAWREALAFRSLALFVAAPAIVSAVLAARSSLGSGMEAQRARLTLGLAAGYVLVLAAQGYAWRNLTDRLTADLMSATVVAPTGCVSFDEKSIVYESPLDHWSLPTLSVVLQGLEPQRIASRTCPLREPLRRWRNRGVFRLAAVDPSDP
jgi:hypothetical protein